ncbi:MAG TPA: penicillin acylase family protein [Polyangiaceae bacterium]|nr:penicillin acylase family protein [Polyangiaceae bacterium]
MPLGAAALALNSQRRGDEAACSSHPPITITRDEYGVPHVFAERAEDLYYGQGYAQGQDRLWQAEIYYRTAVGRMAELLGPDSLEADRLARLLFGSEERMAGVLTAAPRRVRTILESYVAGLNAWVEAATASGQLPLEYAAFGLTPHVWTARDALATYTFFTAYNGSFGADELGNAQAAADLVGRLGAEEGGAVFADTHYLDDPSARTTVPASRRGAGVAMPALGSTSLRCPTIPDARRVWARHLGANPTGAASNAIVLSPRLSASGNALLLGGPQVGYSTPQVFHEVGLHGAGVDVTGVAIAGYPLISIGVTPDFAWTITTGGTDTQDIFAEQLDPADPTRYRYQGELRELACRVESFQVAGADSPVDETFCESVHGPILALQDGVAFALQDSARGEEARSFQATSELPTAHSLREVQRILPGGAFNYNLSYADTHGNIAYWHLGKVPIRAPGANPFLPQPGDGSSDWRGFVPFAEMPHVINPRQGYLVNWNNKPAPGWPNSTAGFWAWGGVHRVNHLLDAVARIEPHGATLESLEELNHGAAVTTDTPSGIAIAVFAPTLLGPLLEHVDAGADARLPTAISLLEAWDFTQVDADADGAYDSPAVALFNAFWRSLVSRIFLDELGPDAESALVGNLVKRLLDGPGAALPLAADYLDGETLDAALTRSLALAIDALTAAYGEQPESWRAPVAETVWTALGAAAAPNTSFANRGTYNQLVELSAGGVRAENVVAPGQNGDVQSPHFADQLGLYEAFEYKPMRIERRDIRRAVESSETLQRR